MTDMRAVLAPALELRMMGAGCRLLLAGRRRDDPEPAQCEYFIQSCSNARTLYWLLLWCWCGLHWRRLGHGACRESAC